MRPAPASIRSPLFLLAAALVAGGAGEVASAQLAGQELAEMEGVGVTQKLGAELPLDAIFQDDTGAMVELGAAFGDRPVLLTLNYVDCKLLCSMQLQNLTETLSHIDLGLGVDYRIVTVSIHPGDTVEQLRAQKERYVTEYRGMLQDAEDSAPAALAVPADQNLGGWTFLRGSRAEIDRVANAVGFGYRWLPDREEYSHAAPTIVCSPDGVVTQYLQGIGGAPEAAAKPLRLMLVDASGGKIGSLLDAVFLKCFAFDPDSGNYKLAFGLLRGAAALTILAIITGLFFMRRTPVDDAGTDGGDLNP